MGEISPPTGADYAWASANQANDSVRILERRVDELAAKIRILEAAVAKLINSETGS